MAARTITLSALALRASIIAANHHSLQMSFSLRFASPPPVLRLAAPPPTLSGTFLCWQTHSHASKLCCSHSRHRSPHPPFTWWCEIPMQLPILYSMSSSGEARRALHGWQSTLLQNCIIRSRSQHRQGRSAALQRVRACRCASAAAANTFTAALCQGYSCGTNIV